MLIIPYSRYASWRKVLDQISVPYGAVTALGAGNQAWQETRPWNHRLLAGSEIRAITRNADLCADVLRRDYNETLGLRARGCLSHIHPLFQFALCGWKHYAVLTRPGFTRGTEWRVGWVNDRFQAISLLPLWDQHVLCLIGPHDTRFFALTRTERDGKDVLIQAPLTCTAIGIRGESGHHHIRLL